LVTHAQQIVDDLEQLPLNSHRPQQSALDFPPTKRSEPVPPQKPRPQLAADEEKVFKQLDSREQTMDRLAELTQLPIHVISSTLLALEMKGLVKQLPGQRYVRRTPL
jgi:DNA processing protein